MDGAQGHEYAAWYQETYARTLAELQARQQEWDYAAGILADDEVAGFVGAGWRELVVELHHDLLALDPAYRLYDVKEQDGGLLIVARFASDQRPAAARLITLAKAAALSTCVVCGQPGRLQADRPQLHTLCDRCFSSDRATASEQGERYAELLLEALMSDDGDYPTPQETLAWLEHLDCG